MRVAHKRVLPYISRTMSPLLFTLLLAALPMAGDVAEAILSILSIKRLATPVPGMPGASARVVAFGSLARVRAALSRLGNFEPGHAAAHAREISTGEEHCELNRDGSDSSAADSALVACASVISSATSLRGVGIGKRSLGTHQIGSYKFDFARASDPGHRARLFSNSAACLARAKRRNSRYAFTGYKLEGCEFEGCEFEIDPPRRLLQSPTLFSSSIRAFGPGGRCRNASALFHGLSPMSTIEHACIGSMPTLAAAARTSSDSAPGLSHTSPMSPRAAISAMTVADTLGGR